MNSKIFRCGWCGHPTNEEGDCLRGKSLKKVVKLINNYKTSSHEHLNNGECCPNGAGSIWEDNYVRVTRDMASDAGDMGLEGRLIKY